MIEGLSILRSLEHPGLWEITRFGGDCSNQKLLLSVDEMKRLQRVLNSLADKGAWGWPALEPKAKLRVVK